MIGAVFYWKGLKSDVKKLVAECDICQRNKSDLAAYRGLIQPFPNPDKVVWLPLAEYWYNTNYHTSTKSTPFEILYGQPPAFHVPYIQGDSVNEAVERTLVAREVAIDVLKFHLERAQNRMKSFTDKGRTDGKFEIGMWVYLKLQPHRQVSIRKGQQHKLSPKYYGLFKICSKVGNVAYKLELPNRKVAKEGNRVVVYLLMQWSNGDKDDATWEPYDNFIQ
ncbi:reverse transcriptase, partial [Tanacetum coccineum]